MISAFDAIRTINSQRDDAVVVYTMSPVRSCEAVSEEPDLDLPIFGGMDKASSVGLGLALAQPSKKVIVLEGDGGLLMNLGTLVTIAGQEPENLVYFVFDDGVYNTTGGQPVPGVWLNCKDREIGCSKSGSPACYFRTNRSHLRARSE